MSGKENPPSPSESLGGLRGEWIPPRKARRPKGKAFPTGNARACEDGVTVATLK